jgi:signal transduction histidine kinase
MTPGTTRTPAFLWQAVLILLPVLVIAVVAVTTIIENRTVVEREARRRAEEVARQYGKELESPWGTFLVEHDRSSQAWTDYLTKVLARWPGNSQRAQAGADGTRSPALEPQARSASAPILPIPPMAEWQAQNPALRAEEVFPADFGFTAEGHFCDGLEYNPAPQPPAWFTRLTLAQRVAWEALKASASSGASAAEVTQRMAQFQDTVPEPEAVVNAAFVALRSRLATLPPQEALAEALRFARESGDALSPAGLPLANLAFEEALRFSQSTGPTAALWEAIPSQVIGAPSPLVPGMLDQLPTLAGTNAMLMAGIDAWRTLWNARLKLYDIASAIRQTGKLRGITTANLWVEENEARWLCILNSAADLRSAAEAGSSGATTNQTWTMVRFLPKAVAEHALLRALENAEIKLPGYLGIAASLEGEPLSLPPRWSPPRGTNAGPAVLAEAKGGLSNLRRLRGESGGPEVELETLPSRPKFVLQLYVADPALLLASYWRHAMLLAGLVAASAFAALVGVIASWRAFQRQMRLNELKSNFVSSVSHELRSPIASVRLMAESLERGKVADPEKQHEYFSFIVQECRRLSSLIENVLDFSRIEQGRKQYEFEPTDLLALTRQTVQLMETYAIERDVQLRLQLNDAATLTATPQLSTIDHHLSNYQLPADGKALQQALVNLIDNALKHSPKGDTVTVGLEVQSPKPKVQSQQSAPCATHHATRTTIHAPRSTLHAPLVLLWVEDHGSGIPPSEQQKIFERFYRSGSELRRQTQGVGIGLSIVKHIVEAHGGKVVVRSAVGQGSRFTIELPLNQDQETETQGQET